MSVKIKYYDIPDGAQEDMKVSAQGQNDISAPDDLSKNTESWAYATLEPGVWLLDGTREIMPGNPKVAFWSQEATGADGRFQNIPIIELTFDNAYSATGITFRFSTTTQQWCREIRVVWFNANSIVAQGNFFPESAEWVLEKTVESFDRVRIELIATNNPKNFAKIERIDIGQTITFEAEQLKNVQLVTEVDPTLCELSADMLTFEVIDEKKRNLIPQESQKVELIRNGKPEIVQYVVSGDKENAGQYSFFCQSIIGLLKGTYLGGVYQEKPVTDLVAEILEGIAFEISPIFENTTVSGYLPIISQRQALQQIAFAVGAIVTTAEAGIIRFLPIKTTTTGVFRPQDIFLGGEVKANQRTAKVEVTSHSYTRSNDLETLMENEEINGSNLLLTFSEPHHSYVMTGGSILSYGENWIRADITGPVTLTAKKYRHTSITHSKRNLKATLKEQGNVVSVSDATLVGPKNVEAALDRLYNACLLGKTVSQEVAVDNQRSGMIAATVTPWGNIITGMISAMNSTITKNGHIAVVELVGIETDGNVAHKYSGTVYSGETEALV